MLLTEPLPRTATLEEFESLPEKAPYQLIRGELIMSPSPTLFHQEIIGNLFGVLHQFVKSHHLGRMILSPMDLKLGPKDVYQPDLIFVRQENVPSLQRQERLTIVPDLVIEVLSPSTAYEDFTRKKSKYCECGVREYWIIDPLAETIEIMVKESEYYQTEALLRQPAVLESSMFPGFTMDLADVFRF
jgi:Uma2 family endonuclease